MVNDHICLKPDISIDNSITLEQLAELTNKHNHDYYTLGTIVDFFYMIGLEDAVPALLQGAINHANQSKGDNND